MVAYKNAEETLKVQNKLYHWGFGNILASLDVMGLSGTVDSVTPNAQCKRVMWQKLEHSHYNQQGVDMV